MSSKELDDFLRQQCKERKLSLRSLSIRSGLSPATAHNIIQRKYQPTLYSLNRLADYLGVRREYLWQLAGLLEDMDYDAGTTFTDPKLRFHLAQVDKLPREARNLIIGLIEAVITYLEGGGRVLEQERSFSLSGDNKGLICPFDTVLCQEGFCQKCQTFHQWWLTQARQGAPPRSD